MTKRLHLVFGGELIDPIKNALKDVNNIHIVGVFPNYEATPASATEEHGL
jgi:hypothetical protein